MTRNQIEYLKLQETQRANQVQEALTAKKTTGELDLRSAELAEQERHNRAAEQVSLDNLVNQRMQASASLQQAQASLQNAETNARNADVNERNAEVNMRNAVTNEYNATTNRYNASINQQNANTKFGELGVQQWNAATRVAELELAQQYYNLDVEKASSQIDLNASNAALNEARTATEGATKSLTEARTEETKASTELKGAQKAETEASAALKGAQKAESEASQRLKEEQANTQLWKTVQEKEAARTAPFVETQEAIHSFEQTVQGAVDIVKGIINLKGLNNSARIRNNARSW